MDKGQSGGIAEAFGNEIHFIFHIVWDPLTCSHADACLECKGTRWYLLHIWMRGCTRGRWRESSSPPLWRRKQRVLTCSHKCVVSLCCFHWADQEDTHLYVCIYTHLLLLNLIKRDSFWTQWCFIPVFAYVGSSLWYGLALSNTEYSNLAI